MIRVIRIVVFLGVLSAALVALDPSPVPDTGENRMLAPLPSPVAAGEKFPEQFDAYFRDHFGLRSRLIRLHNLFKLEVLNVSPASNVILGKDGWLFFGESDGIDIRDFSGRYPVKPAAVTAWLKKQLARRAQLHALGVRYLVVIAPSKHSVYPEAVPERLGKHAPGVLDSWLASARRYPELDVIDLRPVFRAHREEPLYYLTDSHWNANGAFLAAAAIVERARRWFPSVELLRREDYVVTAAEKSGGDLAVLVGLPDRFTDTGYSYVRRKDSGARLVQSDATHRVWERPGTSLPRVLLLGDSFGAELVDRLADSFSRTHVYYSTRSGYSESLVAQEKPDMVVLVLVERDLAYLGFH